MRERAELYGGQLQAGARPGGGFAVTATIPLRQPHRARAGMSGTGMSGTG